MKIIRTNLMFVMPALFWACSQMARASGFDSPECRELLRRASWLSPDENLRAQQLKILADFKAANTTREYVSFDADHPIDNIHAINLIKDPRFLFYLVEPLRPTSMVKHELRTASDYARFAHNTRDEAFVFIAEVNKKSVPFFDGITVDARTGKINSSVSLKYSSIRLPHQRAEVLYRSLAGRFDLEIELLSLLPWEWYRTTNNLASYGKARDEPLYAERFERSRSLMEIFGVTSNEAAPSPLSRGVRLVLDMRDSGYTFEFVKDPVITSEISKLVQQNSVHQLSAALLWDAHRVIEFDGDDVRIFD